MSYDFTIQYHWDSLNSVNESLWKLNYIMKLSKKCEDSMLRQIDDLISMLVNKLATVVLIKMSKQYSCQVRDADSETENLIWMLLLQMITQLKIRLTANDLELYKEISSLDQKTVFLNIFISQKIVFLSIFINESASYNNFDIKKKKSSIFSLIKNVQKFDLLCRWISN